MTKKLNNKRNAATLLALAISSALFGCNDGSGFTSTQADTDQTVVTDVVGAKRNMVSDTGSQIEAPAADSPGAEGVENLIDGDINTKFLTFTSTGQVIFTASKPYVLTGYKLGSANDAPERDPSIWTLEGSNDKENWTEIDSQSGQSFEKRFLMREFEVAESEVEYQYFRFNFTNTSGDIFQLAEMELFVKADVPLTDFTVSATAVAPGEYVIFKDTSLANPTSWQWTFEGGEPATSTERSPLVHYHELGPKTVTLVAANDKGESELVKEYFIRVWDENNPWDGFTQPDINFVKNNPDHPGQALLEQVLPDLEEQIQSISLQIAKKLYNNVTEVKVFNSVQFETGLYDFPAAKAGTDEHMVLLFDLQHIANVAQQGDDALRNEVLGVLWHELTHGYNMVPDSGVYQAGNELHSYLEGLANYIRVDAGYLDLQPGWIESWNQDAYNQTSLFFKWVADTHRNTDFIRLFNASADSIEGWSFDKAFKSIFGEERGIEQVFGEYQTYLKSLGLAPFPEPVSGYRNIAVEDGVVVTTNATHIGVWGEGPDKINDNNINNKFNGVIEEPWWLPEYLPDLMPINDVADIEITFELPMAKTVSKYSLTTGNDNEPRDPTSWTFSGSLDGSSWVNLDSASYPASPARLTTFHYDVSNNVTAYRFYKLTLSNNRVEGVGGDDGRLIQIGEIALLEQE
ncbi:MAG: basic secretory protein-like protein [Cognaticolwellia aestuarii]